jgi:hypothetical protein
MLYFENFPKVASSDYKNNAVLATNLMARTTFIPSLLTNPLLFYSYDIQEGDTPEIVASKYYGDVNRHWLVLYANQIIDPQWQWPLTSQQLKIYIEDKYAAEAEEAEVPSVISYAQQTVKHYQKIFGTNNSEGGRTSRTMIIDKEEYDSLTPETITQNFANGTVVQRIISIKALSIYDYEVELNERKRKIYLVNNIYASQIENQFKELMSQ